VISLSFREDRRKYIINQFKRLNIPFHFFDTIHGKSQKGNVHQCVNFSKLSSKYLSPGSLGCITSHFSVWKKAIESSSKYYLIFEDDIKTEKSFDEILNLLNKIPNDADLVYLGSGCNKTRLNMKMLSTDLARPFSVRKGAYSYILLKSGAIKLVSLINEIKIVCGGIDTILGIFCMRNEIKVYHFAPSLCNVNYNFSSNIYNASNIFKLLHEKEI
jgi:GR25 family glycosyltransferase involved in LPS biosynthesis